jgi:hypothetical protein
VPVPTELVRQRSHNPKVDRSATIAIQNQIDRSALLDRLNHRKG